MSILSQQKQSQNTDFPNIRPSLDLRFALAKKLDPRITFTRGSTGTRINESGLIEVVEVNQPRFDYDPISGECKGLLIEESRSNLLTYSDDFSNAAWNKSQSSIITTNITTPNGATALKLVENTVGGVGHHTSQGSITKSSNAVLTFTIFVKAAERRYLGLVVNDSNGFEIGRYGAEFDLINGTGSEHDPAQGTYSSGSFSITLFPNGWYRCRITCTTSTEAQSQVRIFTFRDTNQWTSASSYQGDGTSGIYIWGAQLEAGEFPTSYIPTTASTVTRSADNASMTGTNFSSWYNQSEGTFFTSVKSSYGFSSGVNASSFGIFSSSNQIVLANHHGAASVWPFRNSININVFLSTTSATTTNLRKTIASYKTGNPEYYASVTNGSGFKDITNSNTYLNSSLRTDQSYFELSPLRSGLFKLNGTISRLTYYPIQITNQQLINLTS